MDIEQRIEALLDQLMDTRITQAEVDTIEAKVKILQRLKQ